MNVYNRAISFSLAMLFALLFMISPLQQADAQEAVRLNVGLVGKVSCLDDLLDRGVASNLILTMLADSLYMYSGSDKAITPQLAEGWPSFSPDGKTVLVKLIEVVDPLMTGLFGLQALADMFEAMVPELEGVTVQHDLALNTLTFKFELDSTRFWDIFAFAPIFAAAEDGTIVGAGYPEYKIGKIDADGLSLDPSSVGAMSVSIKGYKDQAAMVQAFTEGDIDYCMTDLNRTSAQLKGQNWQSASDAVLALVINYKSSVFGTISVRSSALSLVDRPYIVLRTIPGRAIQSTGLYFAEPAASSGTTSLDGLKIRLLSYSSRLDSMEMLCSMLIKSWWEQAGASVSINLPSDKIDAYTRVESGDFDALIMSVWLKPGFTGLLRELGDGGVMQEPADPEFKPFMLKLNGSKSFNEMKEAAENLEASLQKRYIVLPLVSPIKTELYRPEKFQGWNSAPGEPLISSYRDFSMVSAAVAP